MYVIKTIRETNDEMKEQMQALNDRTNQQLKTKYGKQKIISIKS